VSPLFGDLTGVGPVLVFSGTDDILNADAHRLVDALLAAGERVELRSGRDDPRLPAACDARRSSGSTGHDVVAVGAHLGSGHITPRFAPIRTDWARIGLARPRFALGVGTQIGSLTPFPLGCRKR
jgi:hypothetical protein